MSFQLCFKELCPFLNIKACPQLRILLKQNIIATSLISLNGFSYIFVVKWTYCVHVYMCIFTGISDLINRTLAKINYFKQLVWSYFREPVWIWTSKHNTNVIILIIDYVFPINISTDIRLWFSFRLPITNAWQCHSLYEALSSNVGAWGK